MASCVAKPKELEAPTINEVIAVEEVLRNMDDCVITRKELKRRVPLRISPKKFTIIIDYLERTNKIYFGSKGISWIENDNPSYKKALKDGLRL